MRALAAVVPFAAMYCGTDSILQSEYQPLLASLKPYHTNNLSLGLRYDIEDLFGVRVPATLTTPQGDKHGN